MTLLVGLESHWALDEASGDAIDAHGSNTLTASGAIGTEAGKIGTARTLSGALGTYFSIADNASLRSGDVDFSVVGWFKPSSLSGSLAAISKWNGDTNQREFILQIESSRWVFIVSPNGSSQTAVTASNHGTLLTGTWYFVVARHSATLNQIDISVNAGTPNTASFSSGVFAGSSPFRIGALGTGGNPFVGAVDLVSYYKKYLTNDEIAQHYNSGNGLAYASFGGGGSFVDNTRNYLNCIQGGVL